MKKEHFKKIFKYIAWMVGGLALLSIVGGIFYRVFIYPGEIRRECAGRAKEYVQNKDESKHIYSMADADFDYKFIYRNCFQENGLQPE